MQAYLDFFQISLAMGGILFALLIFRYETIDRYVDNRKEGLREILNVGTHPERLEWIQNIGKSDAGKPNQDARLLELDIGSVGVFIEEIKRLRIYRRTLQRHGAIAVMAWGGAAAFYLIVHILGLYCTPFYQLAMLAIFIPFIYSATFIWDAIKGSA